MSTSISVQTLATEKSGTWDVSDTAENIVNALQSTLTTQFSLISSITVSPTVISLTLTSDQLISSAKVIQLITSGVGSISVSGDISAVNISAIASLITKLTTSGITVTDSIANIVSYKDSIANLYDLNKLRTIKVTGSVSSANLDAIKTTDYSKLFNLATATIAGSLSVENASYAYKQHGQYATISDTFLHIIAGDITAIVQAGKIYATGTGSGSDIDSLLAKSYAEKINLSGGAITLDAVSASLKEIDYVLNQKGVYTLKVTYENIGLVNPIILSKANTISYSGPLTADSLNQLSHVNFVDKVLLSSASINGDLSVAIARFAFMHYGVVKNIIDTINNIKSIDSILLDKNHTLAKNLSHIYVTGAVSETDLDSLISSKTYAGKIDLSRSSITDSLTVKEAVYALKQQGQFENISDTASNIIKTPTAIVNAANKLIVIGNIGSKELDGLSANSALKDKLDLSNGVITLTPKASLAEKNYALQQYGTYTLSGDFTSITKANVELLADAHFVAVYGTLSASQLAELASSAYASRLTLADATITDTVAAIKTANQADIGQLKAIAINTVLSATDVDFFMSAAYASKVILSKASITDTLSIAQASYVKAQQGSYANIADTASHIEQAQIAILKATKTLLVSDTPTASDIAVFKANKDYASKIDLGNRLLSDNVSVAQAGYVIKQHGQFQTVSDSAIALLKAPVAIINSANKLWVTGDVNAKVLDAFSGKSNYQSKLDFSHAAITLTPKASLAEKNYVLQQHGTYTLSVDYTSLTKADTELLADAHFVAVSGTLSASQLAELTSSAYASRLTLVDATINDSAAVIKTANQADIGQLKAIAINTVLSATDVDFFMSAAYASKVILSKASITDTLSIAQASYVKAQQGSYANIADTASHIEQAQTAILKATKTLLVSDTPTASDIAVFKANKDYASKIDLGNRLLSDNVSVAQAGYVIKQHGQFQTVSDSATALLKAPVATISTANKLLVTGVVSAKELDAFSENSNYQNKVDFSHAAITLTPKASLAEKNYAIQQQGKYTLSGDFTSITKANLELLASAYSVAVSGKITESQLAELSLKNNYSQKINLANATIMDKLSAKTIAYAHHQQGNYSILDTMIEIKNADQTDVAAANSIYLQGAISSADLTYLLNASYSDHINLKTATIGDSLTVVQASYVSHQNGAYIAVRDSLNAIRNGDATVLENTQANIYVSGEATVDGLAFLATKAYASKLNLSQVSSVFSASEAAQIAQYFPALGSGNLIISDTAVNITSHANASAIAKKIEVTGFLSKEIVDDFMLSSVNYANKLDFSNDVFSGTLGSTVNGGATEANFLFKHGLTSPLWIKDTISNLLNIELTPFVNNLQNNGTATLTDVGVTGNLTSVSGNNLNLTISQLTENITIDHAVNLTSIDISQISGANHSYQISQDGSGNELIIVDHYAIDLIGINTSDLISKLAIIA